MSKPIQIYEISKKSITIPNIPKYLNFNISNFDNSAVLDTSKNPYEITYEQETRPVYKITKEDEYRKRDQYLCISEELFLQFEIITKSENYVNQLNKALYKLQIEEDKNLKLTRRINTFNSKPWYKRIQFAITNKI